MTNEDEEAEQAPEDEREPRESIFGPFRGLFDGLGALLALVGVGLFFGLSFGLPIILCSFASYPSSFEPIIRIIFGK